MAFTKQTAAPDVNAEAETLAKFREALADAAALILALAPFCKTTAEALSVMDLAAMNDGQARMIMDLLESQTKGT